MARKLYPGSYENYAPPREIARPSPGEGVSFGEQRERGIARMQRRGVDPHMIQSMAKDAVRGLRRTGVSRMSHGIGSGQYLGGGHWKWTASKGWHKV
jgi:hypothetical protein